jgi:hypothetical protein
MADEDDSHEGGETVMAKQINAPCPNRDMGLWAVDCGALRVARRLHASCLEARTHTVNGMTCFGIQALITAAESGDLEMFKWLETAVFKVCVMIYTLSIITE